MTYTEQQLINKGETMKKGIRHGEVILMPTEAKVSGKKVKKFIVAHSETGHHHVIEAEAPFTVDEKRMLIELFDDAAIVHKKGFDAHKTLPLKPAVYERYEATEYSPFDQITRRVQD